MAPLKFLGLLNPFAVRGLVSPLALFWELNLTTGCVAADTSVLGSIWLCGNEGGGGGGILKMKVQSDTFTETRASVML